MEELKFKAWDGLRWTTSGIMFNTTLGIVEIPVGSGMKLIQCTGLKDISSIDYYYQKDIFVIDDIKYVVESNFGGWGFYDENQRWTWLYKVAELGKIIGNVWSEKINQVTLIQEQMKTTVKCNKTLMHPNDKKPSFIKGNTYEGNICNVLENLTVTNELGEPHILGSWSKHFKNISKYAK